MAFNPSTFLVGTYWAHGYRLVKITRSYHSTVPKVCQESDSDPSHEVLNR
jgi:hypothetical protein